MVILRDFQTVAQQMANLADALWNGSRHEAPWVWVVPDAPVFADGIARTVELAERGDGEVTVLTAVGRAEADVARLEALFTAERAEEWAEFTAECAKFDAWKWRDGVTSGAAR